IDLDYTPASKDQGFGWMLDDQRPTLTLASPKAGSNPPLTRLLLGMYDYNGLDADTFEVTASFPVNGLAPGQNLAPKFTVTSPGVWELRLSAPLSVAAGK